MAQRTSRPSTALTSSAQRAEPARRACRQANAPSWPAGAVPGSESHRPGPPTVTGATCKCGNCRWQEWSSKGAGWWPGGKSHRTDGAGFAQVTGRPASVQRLESGVLLAAPAGASCPIRTHIRRPKWPPLLYSPAVLTVRIVRISLLTSGAKRARTADLLHAISGQAVGDGRSPRHGRSQGPYSIGEVQARWCR